MFVAAQNVRGLSADRLGAVLRLSLLGIVVLAAVFPVRRVTPYESTG